MQVLAAALAVFVEFPIFEHEKQAPEVLSTYDSGSGQTQVLF
jgi:hypothetical protein